MEELQFELLAELIDQAYAEIGDRPLSEKETDALIDACIEEVERLSYPPATLAQDLRSAYGN